MTALNTMNINLKLWAIKMLFVWRWRCGYWEWDTLRAAWNVKWPNA